MPVYDPRMDAASPASSSLPADLERPETDPSTERAAGRLRAERDRYVALAFAAADLLIEIGIDRRIRMISGACQTLCGHAPADLLDTDIRNLTAAGDRAFFNRLLDCLTVMGRLDPVPVRLAQDSGIEPRVLLGACQLPALPGRIFVTMTLLPDIGTPQPLRDPETGLLSRDDILKSALQASTVDHATPRQLSLLKLDGLNDANHTLPQDRARNLMTEIGAVLRAASLGGDAAGRLGQEEFGLIRATGRRPSIVVEAVGRAVEDSGLPPDSVRPRTGDLDLARGTLTDAQAAKALAFAVESFSRSEEEEFPLTTLSEGLHAAMERTMARFGSLNQLLERGEMKLVFQPVVSLATRAVDHFEILSRFPSGHTPQEVVAFGEELGLVQELDLAVCRKAVERLKAVRQHTLAVNMSSRSLDNAAFRTELQGLLEAERSIASRLIFELSVPAAAEATGPEVVAFLKRLRAQGFRLSLNDAGAAGDSHPHLQLLEFDFVKLNGPFLKSAAEGPRPRALVNALCRLCQDLGSATIATMIETEQEASLARSLKIDFAQGFLYGRPADALPQPTKPKLSSLGTR